ncbi:hypothetical protein [Bacteroides sp. UBA939]|uniref:hypothetical protein n=1 Tax=Bacteroides sp. UBA939 TaxID=1946092 RepID=UPI0025C11C88|nr:hypothetical protein [Bacteroides sp. UBA939]
MGIYDVVLKEVNEQAVEEVHEQLRRHLQEYREELRVGGGGEEVGRHLLVEPSGGDAPGVFLECVAQHGVHELEVGVVGGEGALELLFPVGVFGEEQAEYGEVVVGADAV